MKKIITCIILCCISLSMNAQIFNTILKYDKFDDVINSESHKTLITQTDTTFVVEEKGRKPVVYWIISKMDEFSKGDKDHVANIVNNIYGYEDTWCTIRYDERDQYFDEIEQIAKEANGDVDNVNDKIQGLLRYYYNITHRVISRYSFEFYYDSDYLWISPSNKENNYLGEGVDRVVYTTNKLSY